MFILQFNEFNDGDPEMETFGNLHLALIRAQAVIDLSESEDIVATIVFDNQNDDGNIYEIAYYSRDRNWQFDPTPVPPPSGNTTPYYLR